LINFFAFGNEVPRAKKIKIKIIIIILINAPLTIVIVDQWGDLECMYKACQAAITDGGLFTDTGVDERGENGRHSENDCEMKTVSSIKGPGNRQELVQTRLRRKRGRRNISLYIAHYKYKPRRASIGTQHQDPPQLALALITVGPVESLGG